MYKVEQAFNKNASRRLAELQGFADAINMPFFCKERQGEFLVVNRAFLNLFKVPRTLENVNTIVRLLPHSKIATLSKHEENLNKDGDSGHFGMRIVSPEKSSDFIVHKTAADICGDGALKVVGMIVNTVDDGHPLAAPQIITDLDERVKELECLYDASATLERLADNGLAVLHELAQRIPLAFTQAQATGVKIEFDQQSYTSSNYQSDKDQLTKGKASYKHLIQSISPLGKERGYISVYLDKDVSFLDEERCLIKELARTISLHIEKHEAQKELEQHELLFEHTFEYAAVGICHGDKNGCFIRANKKLEEIWGYSKEEIKGMSFKDVSHPDDIEETANHKNSLLAGEADNFSMEKRYIRKNGEIMWANLTVSLVKRPDQSPDYFIGVIEDITEKRHAIEETKRLTQKVKRTFVETVAALSQAMELRDPYTAGHQEQVSELAVAIAKEMGLDEETVEGLRIGSLLHDIGKLYIPSELLCRPGRLNPEEFALIKTHSKVGAEIISHIDMPWPITEMVLQHHERLDGSGYPHGLSGEAIVLEARIIAVADTIQAMCGHRPYRPAKSVESALNVIQQGKANIYDAAVVDAALNVVHNNPPAWIVF
ncbi:HD domain-containing phosphohydrolase [Agaribacterium sp. ZY112]|uniref:HD-GYP domain-containing protein n=1 Tax=Agaribacterium sp. ZY112 TaxID=3233574 RepID=UPI003526C08D